MKKLLIVLRGQARFNATQLTEQLTAISKWKSTFNKIYNEELKITCLVDVFTDIYTFTGSMGECISPTDDGPHFVRTVPAILHDIAQANESIAAIDPEMSLQVARICSQDEFYESIKDHPLNKMYDESCHRFIAPGDCSWKDTVSQYTWIFDPLWEHGDYDLFLSIRADLFINPSWMIPPILLEPRLNIPVDYLHAPRQLLYGDMIMGASNTAYLDKIIKLFKGGAIPFEWGVNKIGGHNRNCSVLRSFVTMINSIEELSVGYTFSELTGNTIPVDLISLDCADGDLSYNYIKQGRIMAEDRSEFHRLMPHDYPFDNSDDSVTDLVAVDRLENYTNGWIVGDFSPALFRHSDVEIAIQHTIAGTKIKPHYQKIATEYNIILSGVVRVGNRLLSVNDIFIYSPREISDVTIIKDATILVIKSPSLPLDKVMVDDE
jgi:hypothetical protein